MNWRLVVSLAILTLFLDYPSLAAPDIGLGTYLKQTNEAPSALGLGEMPARQVMDEIFTNVLDRAYPNMGALWKTKKVAVCWEDLSQSTASDRAIVQTAVANSWQAHSGLTFTGWQTCVSNNRGIRISVEDLGGDLSPRTYGLGTQIDGLKNGMLLDFTFQNWSQPCAAPEKMRQGCITAVAVHEFGHAIGFAHEQNRPDTPDDCSEPPSGGNGTTTSLTPWDPKSVMNYCNDIYKNSGKLSDLDIYAVQKLYGLPVSQ